MSHTIHLPINSQWFDHIVFGVDGDFKDEEYRALSFYYAKKLLGVPEVVHRHYLARLLTGKANPGPCRIKPGKTTVTLTNGYNPNSRRAEIELLGLAIKAPNPKWVPEGTEGLYFALKLGELLRFGTVEMFKEEDQNNAS